MDTSQDAALLANFVDRETERGILADYFERLGRFQYLAPKVLCFHGVGGVGKTSVLVKALQESQQRGSLRGTDRTRGFHAAIVDLDDDRVEVSLPAAHFLLRLRNALSAEGIRTPLFDYVYLTYLNEELPGQYSTLPDSRPLRRVDIPLDVYALFKDVASFAGEAFAASLPAVGSLAKLWPRLHVWFERTRAQQQFGGKPEYWSQRERVERMPAILAEDLLAIRDHDPATTCCIVIDGFERIQSTEYGPDAQNALRRLVQQASAPGIGWIVLGRNRLRWADLYDEVYEKGEWPERLEFHLLGGLSEVDSRAYLNSRSIDESSQGRDRLATALSRHADSILDAACEESRPEAAGAGGRHYLPYVLHLAVAIVDKMGDDFVPQALGIAPREMESRFLDTLRRYDAPLLDAMKVLSLAVSFDGPLFTELIQAGFVNGMRRQDFGRLTGGDHSFVQREVLRPGSFRFHRHMQACLLRAQRDRIEDRQAALQVVEWLMARCLEGARFATLDKMTASHLQSYIRAMELLQTHASTELMSVEVYVRWFERLDKDSGLDSVTASSTRQPFHEWRLDYLRRHIGARDPRTLAAMADLAASLFANGHLQRSRSLLAEAVETSRESVGANDERTLSLTSHLAWACTALGDIATARSLLEETLARQRDVLGSGHEHTLQSMNRLGCVLHAQGRLNDARSLHEAVLDARQRGWAEDDPDTLVSKGNLAAALQALGEFASARRLQEEVLRARRRMLGPLHPDTLTSLNDLAMTLNDHGDFNGACSLLQEVVDSGQEIWGADHPNTLIANRNLATTLIALGETQRARELQESVLSTQRKVLGSEHPDTLVSLVQLGTTLRAQGDLVSARQLVEDALAIQCRQSGTEHPVVLMSKQRLAWILFATNELEQARSLLEQVRDAQQRILGPEHPSTASSMLDIAETLRVLGHLQGARDLAEQCLDVCRRVIGEKHARTLTCKTVLARICYAQGQRTEAVSLMESAAAGLEEALGPNHKTTLAVGLGLLQMQSAAVLH